MKKLLFLVLGVFILSSCVESSAPPVDIINPDAEFLYFYGATCPHCQDLNAMLEEDDLISQISVEKREIYYNPVNRDSFAAIVERLGIPEREAGVPFVLEKATGKYVSGSTNAFKLLTSSLGNTEEIEDEDVNEVEDNAVEDLGTGSSGGETGTE